MRIDDQVSYFAADADGAAIQFPSEHQAAADSGAHRQEHHVVGCIAEPRLRPSRHVGVVVDNRGQIAGFFE